MIIIAHLLGAGAHKPIEMVVDLCTFNKWSTSGMWALANRACRAVITKLQS